MLPGKKYTPDDVARILWKRKWWLLIPSLLVSAGTFAYSMYLPDRYRAETVIMIVPQRVPADYVRPTVTATLEERLRVISQQLLTRTRLEAIISQFNLYVDERKTMIMEDIIEEMRNSDIRIGTGGAKAQRPNQTSSFSVSFEAPNPRTAVQVTEEIASLFIKENLEQRTELADATNSFLQTQLEDARKRLIEHEKTLEEFRKQNAGRLPSQVNSNLQMMQTAQTQLQAAYESTNRDRDRILFLERALADAAASKDTAAAVVAAAPRDGGASGSGRGEKDKSSAAAQLEAAKTALAALETRLTPAHPDIARAKRVVAELQTKADAEALAQPVAPVPDASAPVTVADQFERNRINEMRLELQQLQLRVQSRKEEEKRLEQVLGSYQSRLEAAPALESQLVELMRDYETLQKTYQSLLAKSEESKIAVNLERRQIGEQFRIIDNARLPEKPVSPDRVRINSMGAAIGLGLALTLVALLEYRDTTIKTDADVVSSLSLPVLAVIPQMITARERRQARRRRLVAVTASLVLAMSGAAVAAWKLRLVEVIEGWVR